MRFGQVVKMFLAQTVCMILEYFSLGKGPWGRLEKFLSYYFRIIISYLKMSGMPWSSLEKYPQNGIKWTEINLPSIQNVQQSTRKWK